MRPRIFRNFGIKVLSIGLAALLWGLVAGQREAERSLRVPLEYRNIPSELELLGEPASLVDVRIRGSSGVLGELRGADLVAVLDLRTARPGAAGAVPPAAERHRRAGRRQGAAGRRPRRCR